MLKEIKPIPNDKKSIPLLDPFVSLLYSRKFLLSLLIVIMNFVSDYFSLNEQTTTQLTAVFVALITAIAVEDYAEKRAYVSPIAPVSVEEYAEKSNA